MNRSSSQQTVAHYYSRWESRLGYLLVMKGSQHFGYYDKEHTTEKAAQRNYHEKFAKLLRLKPGMNVLDAGCGQGVVACYLAKNFNVHVTGITITPYEAKAASKMAHKLDLTELAVFKVADYAKPNLPVASFDRIYTTESLSHAEDVQQVLDVLFGLLKPGGFLVCAEYEMDKDSASTRMKQAANFLKEHAAIHGIYQFGKGQFRKALSKSSFVEIEEEDWTQNMKPSFDRLRRLAGPLPKIVKILHIERFFVNTVAAELYADGVEQGVFAYKLYSAQKRS